MVWTVLFLRFYFCVSLFGHSLPIGYLSRSRLGFQIAKDNISKSSILLGDDKENEIGLREMFFAVFNKALNSTNICYIS